MARLRTIDGYGCDWHDDNEPDGSCTCLFKCDSCGTEYRQGDHPAKKCVVELTRQLAEARKAAEWKPITPEMKLTKNHVLATGLDASHTFVMAYSGGYRNGASALADDWNYCMKLNPPAPEGASK